MATLPQDHQYQIDLRDWLATLVSTDFDVTLGDMEYDDSYFVTNEDVYRFWSTFENLGRYLPDHRGFRHASSHFLLSNIEGVSNIMFNTGTSFFDPMATAFWVQWNYPGNPHYNSDAIRRRCMVAASVDMIMLDFLHEDSGGGTRSDFLGMSLSMYGYAYTHCSSVMTTAAKDAFKAGMLKMFEKLETWGPTGINADMDTSAIYGMWVTANIHQDEDLFIRARVYAQNLIDTYYSPAGYVDHGSGYEGSYNGISLRFLNWTYAFTKYPFLREALEEMARLKSATIFVEPGGWTNSPSHHNTATAHGPDEDQFWSFYRDMAHAHVSDEAKFLLVTGRTLANWYNPYGAAKSVVDMKTDIQNWTNTQNTESPGDPIAGDFNVVSTQTPSAWAEFHWYNYPQYVDDIFRTGFYDDEMLDIADGTAELAKSPYLRSGDWIHNFNDEILAFKLGNMGGVISSTPLSWWSENIGLPGFVGGSLSGFWTRQGGTMILGKLRGYQGADADDWDNFREWGTHHIWGVAGNDKPFSSARNGTMEKDYFVDGNTRASVSVVGKFQGKAGPDFAVTPGLTYQRTFDVDRTGVTVKSMVYSDGVDTIKELYDTIPVYLRDSIDDVDDAVIKYLVDETWATLTTTPTVVRKISITRNGYTTIITFKKKQTVSLVANVWTTSYQTKARLQGIDIHMVTSEGTLPEYTYTEYKISGPYIERVFYDLV